nr:cytochrome c oxidase subunit 2 [Neurospora crassa, strain [exn-5], Peptide Partial Mutant, 11 aa] [Neurospora crassa]
FQDSAIPQMEG